MTLASRPATAADVDAVVELERTCLGDDAWSRGLVEQGVAAALPTVAYLVAELDGTVVGHAVASAAGDDAELQRIAVAPAYRRSGVASALLAEVERRAAEDGATRLLLEVREDNADGDRLLREPGLRGGRPPSRLLPGRCRRGGPGEEGRTPRRHRVT